MDSSADAAYYLEYLRTVSAQPWAREYKRRTFELLHLAPGMRVLDVGCGRGDDLVALSRMVGPSGAVVGVDSSDVMLDAARATLRAASVQADLVEADATALPFPEGSFDASRADRTLQHVRAAEIAVAELVRVCRRGGRVVVADPDWDTLVVDAPDLEASRLVAHTHADEIANGTIGRRLRRLLLDAGLVDVVVEPMPIVFQELRPAEATYGLSIGLRKTVEAGRLTRERADAWWRSLVESDARGRFWAGMFGNIAAGTRQ